MFLYAYFIERLRSTPLSGSILLNFHLGILQKILVLSNGKGVVLC